MTQYCVIGQQHGPQGLAYLDRQDLRGAFSACPVSLFLFAEERSIMKHYLEGTEAVFEAVGSGAEGISEQEAATRLEKNGKNKLAEGKKESLLHRFLKQLAEPMTIILLVAHLFSTPLISSHMLISKLSDVDFNKDI